DGKKTGGGGEGNSADEGTPQDAIRTADHQPEQHEGDPDHHLPAEDRDPGARAVPAFLALGYLQARPLGVELFDAHPALAAAAPDEGDRPRAAGAGRGKRLPAPGALAPPLRAGIAIPAREANDPFQAKRVLPRREVDDGAAPVTHAPVALDLAGTL